MTATIGLTAPQEAAAAGSTVCGSGFKMTYNERLPDARRFGTVFTYQRSDGNGHIDTCVIFDNNLAGAKYMKLKLCPNDTARPCSVDEGNFTSYAVGIVLNADLCPKVTLVMKESQNSSSALIDRVFHVPPCD
ncbi:hypothetical protein ABT084_05860 [Streptomyces sp. NPDC002138]|uniref:hypothetical protein n=1 Tax=Streptomyces sp. NPDC002138 TaxID=3154410 RepID=UPI00332240DB